LRKQCPILAPDSGKIKKRLALDKRVTTPGQGEATVQTERDGIIQLKPVRLAKHEPFQVVLDVPVKSTGKTRMLRLCDYASSGHTWKTNSTLRVWLPQPLHLETPFEGIAEVKP
jgi:hypothetical protein